MVESIRHWLSGLPKRAQILGGCGAVTLVAVIATVATTGDIADLGVADSGAGDASSVPAVVDAQPATPAGTQPATSGELVAQPSPGMAPVTEGGGGEPQDTPESQAATAELNAKTVTRGETKRPHDIAASAPSDVVDAGRYLSAWSEKLKACLGEGVSAPLVCFVETQKAVRGVEYQDGMLSGSLKNDVSFQIYRSTSSGVRVWLLYENGTECRGYGTNFEMCAAW